MVEAELSKLMVDLPDMIGIVDLLNLVEERGGPEICHWEIVGEQGGLKFELLHKKFVTVPVPEGYTVLCVPEKLVSHSGDDDEETVVLVRNGTTAEQAAAHIANFKAGREFFDWLIVE